MTTIPPFDSEEDARLEALVGRKLRQLSGRRAPETLLPRVLAAIEAQAHLPWWQRSWSYWPRGFQIALLPILSLCATVVVYVLWQCWQYLVISGVPQRLTESLAPVARAGSILLALVDSLFAAGRVVLSQPVFLAGLLVIAMLYLATIGLGSVCFRLLVHKR